MLCGEPSLTDRTMLSSHIYAAPQGPGREDRWGRQSSEVVACAAQPITAFYLNLDQEAARRRCIEEQLAEAGIPAERIEAVDGSRPLPPEVSLYFDAKHVMDAGALGCYASHIKAWEQITRKALPSGLVLEDDAILPAGLAGLLAEIVAALPTHWDMVHLGTEPDRAVCEIAKVGSRKIVQFSRVPPGAVGYLVSKAGAAKLLRAKPRRWPIDTDTRRPWVFGLNVYGVVAPPIGHNWLVPSTIRARGSKRRTPRRGLRAAFANPIRNLDALLFNWRRLGPLAWWRCLFVNSALKLRGVIGAKAADKGGPAGIVSAPNMQPAVTLQPQRSQANPGGRNGWGGGAHVSADYSPDSG
jgi:glycosyl transferase, family 25